MFVLKNLIEIYLNSKLKLYCAFVDFKKAFNTIWRCGLWVKLIQHGIEGNVFRIVHQMYQNVKTCVSDNGNSTPFFSSTVGVRQGENLSPLLFAIYVNDLESLLNGGCTNIEFGNNEYLSRMVKLFLLLYADDTVVIADSPAKLQTALNALEVYCDRWKLRVNVDETEG